MRVPDWYSYLDVTYVQFFPRYITFLSDFIFSLLYKHIFFLHFAEAKVPTLDFYNAVDMRTEQKGT